MTTIDVRTAAARVVAVLCATAIVCRLAGLGVAWLPATPALALGLALSQVVDWFLRRPSRLDLTRLAREHAFEIGVVFLAVLTLAVRLPGLTSDLGHVPLDIDENRLASNIQRFFVTGEVGHETVEHYPGVAFWLFAGAAFLRFVRGLGAGSTLTPAHYPVTEFVAAARIANVFVAAGIVVLSALIGRRIGGRWAGLLAGLLVAIAPLSVDTTTVCRCDPVMLLAVLGAVQISLVALDRPSTIWFTAAGAVAGIAAGVKYSGVFAIAPVLLAALTLTSWRGVLGAATRAIAAFVLAIAVTNHFIWYDFPNFLIQLVRQVAITGAGHWAATANPAGFYVATLSRFGPGAGLTLLAALFAIATLATRRLSWWVFVSFPLLYLAVMTGRPSQLGRWVYPMLPFVAVASCACIAICAGVIGRTNPRRASRARLTWSAAVIALVALLAWPVWAGLISFSRRISTPTHTLAERWVADHARAGSAVLVGRGWLDLSAASVDVRRADDLKKTLDGGLDALAGTDLVVVPEPYFGHPTLRQLGFLDRIHTEWRVGSSAGYDYEFYAVPRR